MPSKILLIHNYYQQRGGEDESFAAETNLLQERGHDVLTYTLHNDSVAQMSSLALAKATLWNSTVYRELRALIRREKPDLVHCNNTFPLISPAAYYAARAEGLPVIQNLRNYRLYCVNGLLFRDGHVCEDCLGKAVAWRGVMHGCYRDNQAASAVAATMFSFHRALQTWTRMVDVYITLTQFARQKFIEAGLPAEKMVHKPNFLSTTPEVGKGTGGYALFVGRLSPEKGLHTLLEAWKRLDGALTLKIVGDGPLATEVAQAADRIPGIEWLGRQPQDVVYQLMGDAQGLVFPSEWYETFGRVGMEAFAKGTPVIAANIGAIAELVDHRYNGMHFRPGDVDDLVTQVRWALDHPAAWQAMRYHARQTFEAKYTAARNYERMMAIYGRVHQQPTAARPRYETAAQQP